MTSNPERVAILGLGQMGLVCAQLLASSRSSPSAPVITMWGHDPETSGLLAQSRRSERLPSYELPEGVRVAMSPEAAMYPDGEPVGLIVTAIPVQFMRESWGRVRERVPPGAGVVSVAKGIENGTLLRPTQIVVDVLRDDPDVAARPVGCLSGPTIATEVSKGLPATMVAASGEPGFAERVQRLFSTSWMRVYRLDDLLGVELAGATKNVIALAAGIIDGLGAGANAKSALLARGLVEICRLGTAMGASREAFFGLAGVGDLATTCFSPEGRNRSCGEALGRGARLEAYLERSPFVVEGVSTTRAVCDLAARYRVEMPITQTVREVLFEGLDPLEGIGRLMGRELRDEGLAGA